ncbi:MAG TPA: AsmA-like C-terminal domain-containing protein [Nitrospiraceae bacterium]|nr:AsmA-like C-terminal domain-containing protein [Nitrospiraceae bacterium]
MERNRRPRFAIPRWFLILALFILLGPAVQAGLNLAPVRGAIAQLLASETGLEAGDLRIRLVPRPRAQLFDVVMRDPVRQEPVFRAQRVEVMLALRPLLRREFALAKVLVVNPRLTIRRDAGGRWHLPFENQADAVPEPDQKPEDRLADLPPVMECRGGEVVLVVDREQRAPDSVRMTDIHFSFVKSAATQRTDLSLGGRIDSDGTAATLSVTGVIMSLDQSKAAAPARDAAPTAPLSFAGKVEVHGLATKEWSRWLGPGSARQDLDDLTDATVQVNVAPGQAGYDVGLSQLELRLDWLVLQGEGGLQGLGTEQPRYTAVLSSSAFRLETFIQHVPVLWVDQEVRAMLARHEGAGLFEVVEVSVSGRVGEAQADDWKGIVKVSQGHVVLGKDRVPVHDLSGMLLFDLHTVQFMDLKGAYGPIQISGGALTLSHVQVAPTLDLGVAGEVQAGDLLRFARHTGDAEMQQVLRERIDDAAGPLRLSVRLAGGLTPEPKVALVRAEISGHGLEVRSAQMLQAVEQIDAHVIVTPRAAEVRQFSGVVGPLRFETKGAVEFEPLAKLRDLSVRLEGRGEELLPFVGIEPSAYPGLAVNGPLRATATIQGLWLAPRFKGMVVLDQAALTVAPVIDKPEGVPTTVTFEGRFSDRAGLTLSRLDVRLPFVRLEGRAKVGLAPSHRFTVHLAAGPVSIARLESGFSPGPLKEGVLKVSLDAKGRWSDWASSRLNGWAELRNGVIHDERMKDALRDVALRVQLAGREVNIERISFKLRESDVMIKGFMKRLLRQPDIVLTIESSKLDLWRLLSQTDKAQGQAADAGEPLLDRLRRWAHAGHADVGLLISQAQYRRLQFTTLSAHLRMGEGRIQMDRFSGDTKEGTVAGEASLDFLAPSRVDLTGAVQIDGVPVQRVVSLFEPNEEIVRGLASLTGKFQGTFQEGTPFLGTLRTVDPVKVRIDHGQIVHGTVLPKVLKILNVPALLKGEVDLDRDGVPFESVAATVAIKDGVLASEDIRFDSPIVKVSGAGTHNLLTDQLDLALAVSPLGAYSDTISKIPLFGQLLAGDRPGLTTALFEVKGPRSDPDVRYLPAESVAKGLTGYPRLAIDVLTNLVPLSQEQVSPTEPR